MMERTIRKKPLALRILEALATRVILTREYKQYQYSLKMGWEGECWFDAWVEQISCEHLTKRDLRLRVNRTKCQIDTLVITEAKLYLYEVKNYEGDYKWSRDKLVKCSSQKEIVNPSQQLNRAKIVVTDLLRQLGISLAVEAFVVYINPTFTLYEAPQSEAILFVSQLEEHIGQLNKQPRKLTYRHERLARHLEREILEEVSRDDLPEYSYEELKKSLFCSGCRKEIRNIERIFYRCEYCGMKELVADSILKHVHEYCCLFPEEKLTTTVIQEWCGFLPSRKRVRLVLDRHFTAEGTMRWRSYVNTQ